MGLFGRKPETGKSSQHGDYENKTTSLSSQSEFNAAKNAMVGGEFYIEQASSASADESNPRKTRQHFEKRASASFEAAQKCLDANREQVLEEGKNRDNNDRRLPGSPW